MHVLLRTPAEAAARQHRLDLDAIGGEAENAGDRHMISGLQLAAEPRQRALAVPLQVAVERLHGGVRKIREHELRLDDALRAAQRRLRIAFGADQGPRALRQRAVVFDELRTAAPLRRLLIPRHAKEIASLGGGPEALRVDGHPRGDLLYVHDTRD